MKKILLIISVIMTLGVSTQTNGVQEKKDIVEPKKIEQETPKQPPVVDEKKLDNIETLSKNIEKKLSNAEKNIEKVKEIQVEKALDRFEKIIEENHETKKISTDN